MKNDNIVAGESGKNRRSDLISPFDPRKDQVDLNHSWHVCLTCSYNLSTRKTAPVARRAIPGLNSSHRQKVLSTVKPNCPFPQFKHAVFLPLVRGCGEQNILFLFAATF